MVAPRTDLRFRRLGFVAIAALCIALAWPMQGGGPNELSHYALIRALAEGAPEIDETRFQTGDYVTGDVVRWHEHWYSNKAPGLAFWTLPSYLVARAIGVPDEGEATPMLWALSFTGAVIPALALLLLVRAVAERFAPGTGAAVAVVLGGATLLLPFATLFHAHVFSTTLVFAAFASLFLLGRRRLSSCALGGVLAGFAVLTEYPTGLAALVLCAYAVSATPRLRRVGAYLAGFAVGVAPLLAYNAWAFGSIWHFSWAGTTSGGTERPSLEETPSLEERPSLEEHASLEERPSLELAGQGTPDLEVALESLFGLSGLLTTMPVLALGVPGLVLLARRGFRAEAAAFAAIVVLFLVFNASYGSEFDSYRGGERYLIVTLPFLLAPLGLALRRWPATTVALSIVSAVMMIALASSHVRTGDPDWLGPLADRQFPRTILSAVDVTGWYSMLPFFVALGVAFVAAAVATPRVEVHRWDVGLAGAAVLGWAVVAAWAPQSPRVGGDAGALVAYLPAALVAAALACGLVASSAALKEP